MANSDYHIIIKQNWPELLKRIETKGELLGELKKYKREFTTYFVKSVWDNQDTAVRVDKLLTHISIGGEERFNCFCTALRDSGQHYVVDELLMPKPLAPSASCVDRSDAVPVDAACNAAAATSLTIVSPVCLPGADEFLSAGCAANLTNNWNDLYCNLRCDEEFLSHLKNVFTDMQVKKLKDTLNEMERVNCMLHWLEKGSQATFDGFCESLVKTNQLHMAAILKPIKAMAAPCSVPVLCTEQDNQDNRIQQSTEGRPVPCSDRMDSEALRAGSEDTTLSSARNAAADEDFIRNTVIKSIHAQTAYVIKCALAGNRGRVLIINNVKFINAQDNRMGAEVDEANLVQLFTLLNYKLVQHRDKTAAEIRNILEEEQKHEDHKLADSFILFILSHGSENKVSGCDNENVSLDSIVKYFDGKNCPSLVGKPKLFFIQACQGDQTVPEVTTDAISERLPALNITDDQAVRTGDPGIPDGTNASLEHEKLHTAMVVSAFPGYDAYRSEQDGSVFVQALCEVFKKSSGSNDLSKMLTELTCNMSRRRVKCDGKLCKPLCVTGYNTLIKEVYLLPGGMLQKFYNEFVI